MDVKNDNVGAKIWPFLIAIMFVVGAWVANFTLLVDEPHRGVYGDMFGAVNSVFSGLAFAGVVYAIILQRHEVQISREELRRTKEILDSQSFAIAEQNRASLRRSFEETFFQLLMMHNEILNSIDLQGATTTSGRDVFSVMRQRLGSKSDWNYQKFYDKNGQELGHYYRWLYNIFKYIEEKIPDVSEQRFYGNLVRAQMSDKEVALLYFNALSKHGEKFKPLVEKYGLLKHLKEKDLINSGARQKDYDASAFGVDKRHPHWLSG